MGCGNSSTAPKGKLAELKARLPVERTHEDQQKRSILYAKFDVRKANSLTEQECLDGCEKHLELHKLTDQLPLVNKRAFVASSCLRTRPDATSGVDPAEFRLYLAYLRFYFELNEMFTEVDTANNRVVTREEFKRGVPKLKQWGLRLDDPDIEFNNINAQNEKGATFDEFADWAIRKQLLANQNTDPAVTAVNRRVNNKIAVPAPIPHAGPKDAGLEEKARECVPVAKDVPASAPVQPVTIPIDTDIKRQEVAEALQEQKELIQQPVEHTAVETIQQEEPLQKALPVEHTTVETIEHTAVEAAEKPTYAEEAARRKVMWEDLKLRLPRSRTPEQNAERSELFKQFDPNGSNKLSYSEVEYGAETILKLQDFTSDYKMILRRAFDNARTAAARRGNREVSTDFVERIEFRLLLVYVYDYFELWVMFDELDTSGDRKVSYQEFTHALPRMEEWGVKVTDPEATFKSIDNDGSGVINFDEFCEWAINQHLDVDGDENES